TRVSGYLSTRIGSDFPRTDAPLGEQNRAGAGCVVEVGCGCALIGDAAHCPTFLSGMGSSLALQDAHILAGCLARHPDDLVTSLAQYEEVMSPIARRYKDSAVSAHRTLLGSNPFKAHLRDLVLRMIPDRLFERGVHRFFDA